MARKCHCRAPSGPPPIVIQLGKVQPAEQDLVVVDLPAARDHDDHRDGIGPVHDAERQRVKCARKLLHR